MIYLYLTLFLLATLIIAFTIGLDLFLHYKSIFNRIKIGRWNNTDTWLQQISKINYSWLKKTPTVKITDNTRYVILDIIKGKYRSGSIQSWQEGGMLLGATAVYNKYPTTSHKEKIDEFIKERIDENGSWKIVPAHVDGVLLAYAIAKQFNNPSSIKPALDKTIALIEDNKGKDNSIFYRSWIPEIRFVDTIGFICPFLTYYGVQFNQPEYIDLAFKQIEQYLDKAFLKNKSIPAHAFNINNNMPLGIYGWGRGLGWFILGITDMNNELPNTNQRKGFLENLILSTAKDTLPFQRENGSFGAMLAVKDYRHDSSITTLAGWLFLNAYKINNDQVYLKAAQKCVNSLMKATRRNGIIDFCQGDTKGIGDYAKTFDVMPFVQGLAIRLTVALNEYTSHID